MISYSTNWMGPISSEWYENRGLDPEIESFSGGRIDIYGLNETEHYGGMSEYALPVMHGEDWDAFSEWLDGFETESLWTLKGIINQYQKDTGKTIRWADDTNINEE